MDPNVEATGLSSSNVFTSSEKKKLKTSQKETISDGTILGLSDVIFKNHPDLTYFCPSCQYFVNLLSLKDHKSFHDACHILEYDVHQLPRTSKALLKRRNSLLADIKEVGISGGTPINIRQIQRIDDAYEIIKQEIEDTFQSCRKIDEGIDPTTEGSDVTCALEFVEAIGFCTNRNSRWKPTMEDTKVYQDYFGNDESKAFLALYDGNNGRYASAVAANELHYLLLNELSKFDRKASCKCTFNMFEENDITQYDLIRPPSPQTGNKRLLHKESKNDIHQVIYTCEQSNVPLHHLSSHHPNISSVSSDSTPNDAQSRTTNLTTIKDEYSMAMRQAFRRAYKLTDRILSYGGDEKSRVRWSSCSALTVVMEDFKDYSDPFEEAHSTTKVSSKYHNQSDGKVEFPDGAAPENEDVDPSAKTDQQPEKIYDPPQVCGRLHIAHVGNVQAVLVRDNHSYLLTKSHTHQDSREKKRVEAEGGCFSQSEQEMRVNGVSVTTRALGNHGDPNLKRLVIWEPKCTTVPVDQYAQFLILATNGVWEVFSPQTASELLLQMLPQNQMPVPGYVSPSIDQLLWSHVDIQDGQVEEYENHSPSTNKADVGIDQSPPGLQGSNHSAKAQPVINDKNSSHHLKSTSPSKEELAVTENVSFEPINAEQRAESADVSLPGSVNPTQDIDMRSDDSGNEADVDTDWASTTVPADLVDRVISSRIDMHRQFSKLLAERLVQCALLAGAKDNISAVVVLLPGTKL